MGPAIAIAINVVVFVGIFVLVIALVRWNAKKTRERLAAVAARFPGMTMEPGTWLRLTRLVYSGAGWKAVATFFPGAKNSPPYSRVEFQLDRPLPTLKLSKQGIFSGIARFFGAQDVQIGIPEFDQAYMIAANPPEFAGRFLTPDTRRRIEELRAMIPGYSPMLIEVSGTIARVSLGIYFREVEKIVEYLRKTFELAGVFAETTEAGRPRPADACPVCGQSVAADPSRCKACATTAHRACWDYLGACPNFGCGGARA